MKKLIYLYLCYIIVNIEAVDDIRETQYGLIRGKIETSIPNPSIEYYSFKGIPFAKPPLKELRFQEPQPHDNWSGVRPALTAPKVCMQLRYDFSKFEIFNGGEDCLYLDVYEPITAKRNTSSSLPVMVWIYGGGFQGGSTSQYGPDYIMEKPVILVEISYRLNVFGFLSVLGPAAQGNAALKDQNFGLRWVKNNIANFGGNPDQVTIFGESAGGVAVQYQMLSPKSAGLFSAAISQSGSTLNQWALQKDPLEMARRLARGLGINETDPFVMVNKLQQVDAETLLLASVDKSIMGNSTNYFVNAFSPSLESHHDGAFISQSTFETLEKGNFTAMPYMVGYTSEEGALPYGMTESGAIDITMYERHPELFIPVSMNIPANNVTLTQPVVDRITDFYFKNGSLIDKFNWISFMNQDFIQRGVVKTMEMTMQSMPVYLYRFSFMSNRTIGSQTGGVPHFGEMKHLFYLHHDREDPNETPGDTIIRHRMVTMWTNFATTGNPTPERDDLLQNILWPSVTPHDRTYLEIGSNLELLKNANQPDSGFWEKLFQDFGIPPYETY